MPLQLRIYTINRGQLNTFVTEWRQTIKPLREKLGFEIPDAWTIPSANQFIWLMKYDGPDPWDELDLAFHNSEERRAMTPNPARNIARMEEYFIEPV
jgi:hypothetical protein